MRSQISEILAQRNLLFKIHNGFDPMVCGSSCIVYQESNKTSLYPDFYKVTDVHRLPLLMVYL